MYNQIKINEDTWAFETVMDDGDSVRFFLLAGEDAALVIDSGFFPIDVHALVQQVLVSEGKEKASDGKPKKILLANTHGDVDHTGGNASFDQFYMTQIDYDNLNIKEQCPDSVLIPATEETRIDLGGRIIQYIMTPGHTKGNAALLDLTNKVLYPGDMIQTGNMFMFGSHRCPEKMAGSLEKLNLYRDRFDRIFACHGEMILPADAVDETIKAWNMVLDHTATIRKAVVLGTEVEMHMCGYCNFYCDK